jgi:hypothetical protein
MRSILASNRFIFFIFLVFLLAPQWTVAEQLPASGMAAGIIMVADFSSADVKKGVPGGWELDRKTGKPVFRLEKDGQTYFLNMVSDQASFGIKKAVNVNIKEYPFLNWTWKVRKLPAGGDVRKAETDDQAIQIYLAFPATGFPAKLNTPVIGYIWDSEAPKSWTGRSQQMGGGKLRYVVVRNKSDAIDEWYTEKRNVYNDYQKLFKDLPGSEPKGPAQGISFYINSQHTRSAAESYIGSVYFSRQ